MEWRNEGDKVVIVAPKKLTHKEIEETDSLFRKLMAEGRADFVLDAGNLVLIDSYFIGFLVTMLKNAREKGGEIQIRNLQGHPLEVFQGAALDQNFTMERHGNVKEAKEKLFNGTSRPGLDIEHEMRGGVAVFKLSGNMYVGRGVQEFRRQALLAMEKTKKFVIDLTFFTRFDSAAIAEVLRINSLLKESAGGIRFCSASYEVRDWIKTLNIDELIPVYKDMRSAVEGWE